jgi:hypothetical protein
MVQGGKNPAGTAPQANGQESEEIDRIMKEIEDLEKKMDSPTDPQSLTPETPTAEAQTTKVDSGEKESAISGFGGEMTTDKGNAPSQADFEEAEVAAAASDKVVPFRGASAAIESLAESDAVPVEDAPLIHDTNSEADGGLSLKIGGCAEVALEFTRAGMTVSLSCTDEGLTITTDQGAEFRIPFKRAA